jgi:hypothetical protein
LLEIIVLDSVFVLNLIESYLFDIVERNFVAGKPQTSVEASLFFPSPRRDRCLLKNIPAVPTVVVVDTSSEVEQALTRVFIRKTHMFIQNEHAENQVQGPAITTVTTGAAQPFAQKFSAAQDKLSVSPMLTFSLCATTGIYPGSNMYLDSGAASLRIEL